jgi:hypothetical protein
MAPTADPIDLKSEAAARERARSHLPIYLRRLVAELARPRNLLNSSGANERQIAARLFPPSLPTSYVGVS